MYINLVQGAVLSDRNELFAVKRRKINIDESETTEMIEDYLNVIPWVISYERYEEEYDGHWCVLVECEGEEPALVRFSDIIRGIGEYLLNDYTGCCPACTKELCIEEDRDGNLSFMFSDICSAKIVLQLAMFDKVIYG